MMEWPEIENWVTTTRLNLRFFFNLPVVDPLTITGFE